MGYCKFSKFSFVFLITILFVCSGVENKSSIWKDGEALVAFKSGIISDPEHALDYWNATNLHHVCNWSGVGCNQARDGVVQLDLSGMSLKGTISPALVNLSSLVVLDLSNNLFHGHIPPQLSSLVHLKQLSLSWNLLQGNIPSNLGFLNQLVYLDLGSNHLSGQIPAPLFCNGSNLQYIDLSNNSLSGELPSEFAVRQLRYLLLWSNRLAGPVPQALSNSSKLQWLDLESNMFSGELPSDIVSKMPELEFLYLSYNQYVSHDGNTNLQPFFASLINSSKFQELELAGNNLGGEIPNIIGHLSSNLVQIHLDDNLIYGSIPPQISNLVNLTLLNFSANLLNGTIPPQLCRIQKLERLYLSNNTLSGHIPSALGNITHLGLLDLSKNMLSGSIPDTFSNLFQLRTLMLYGNQLSGTIPPSLGKCVNLEILDLSHNKISGVIPGEVAGLRSLKLYLNLSSNHLHGPLPLELSKMDMVLAIDLSSNNLSGTIPSQLGSCIALEYLNLSGNILEGGLPAKIGQLPYLRELDVASNQLIGDIPLSFQASSTLKEMNFSFNKFQGNISDKGAFSWLTVDSFIGNVGLCGSIKGMPNCRNRHASHLVILVPIIITLFTIPLLFMFVYPVVLKSVLFRNQMASINGRDFDDEEKERSELKYPKISYRQLIEATGGFNASSLIGSGQFGHVYKGILDDNTRIAVKVLDTKTRGDISGSFKRECEVLRRTRHRNLMRIITICSKPDFKALVLPLMPNGSLERHLYLRHGHGLDLIQLVNICSDVAEAVAYLHHYSPVKVVHCDLKPSNILLDEDMTALVTDFGISRLVRGDDDHRVSANNSLSFTSTDGLLCGSIGYIAPEYGMGKRASTQGDVYSFGVLLLEIVTGRRPTDSYGGWSLHEWMKSQYPHKLEPIVKEAVTRWSPCANSMTLATNYEKIWDDVILELLELGLLCTQYNPSTRPTMVDVALEMGRLKHYLANPDEYICETKQR